METVRIRVIFEDRHILSKSQRSEGLKRSWLLLKPSHETISDISSYLTHIFDLYDSCPNGIILSMDGFVLPPFEYTCILKDKDVIRVKRKGRMLSDIVEVGNEANLIDKDEIVEKTDMPLLANEEFEKETGGYESEPEEDEDKEAKDDEENSSARIVVSKKRKASKKLKSPKKKKKRPMDPQDTECDFHMEQQRCEFHPGKSIEKKKKAANGKREPKNASTPKNTKRNNDIFEPLPSPKRSDQLQNGAGCANVPKMPDGTRKFPSRSARRKKAKRQWLRELAKSEKRELLTPKPLRQMQSPEKDTKKNSRDHQEENPNSEANNEIVEDDKIFPIVIRPGHIRFEPLGNDQGTVRQNQVSVETFQWNGITNKKKGQKWGKEKFPSWRNDHKDSSKECSEMTTIDKVKPPNDPIDFDKLAPLTTWPKEGDVIAYQLLELSTNWTPELTSFRVGKASRYDPESNRVLLTPVPEYPIIFEKPDEEDTSAQPDNSIYREDGSLEIDFPSLVNARIVKHGNSDPAKAAVDRGNDWPVGNEVAVSTVVPSSNDKQTHAPTLEEGEINAWDEIGEVLSAKKEQLIRENGWKKASSGRSLSYRALRGSAVGPTMAILRARNDI